MIRFIGVSFGVIDRKLCVITTSEGQSLFSINGISSREGLEFLNSLWEHRAAIIKTQSSKLGRPVMVMYDSGCELELLLKDAPAHKKDILFGLYRMQENRAKETPLFDPVSPEYKGIIEQWGFRLSVLPGKILKVGRVKKAGLVFFDIASYFDLNIQEAADKFLGEQVENARIERNLMPLWNENLEAQLLDRYKEEAQLITRLADKVRRVTEPLNLGLRQWYGPAAIASKCLHKWNARRQAKRLTDRNSPQELLRAIDCAYIGGRVEYVKLGTIEDVTVLDINSAYAYATTLLARFHTPLRFTREYRRDCPFSCWFVTYKLPAETTVGILPNRQQRGGISFRREGKGYFWWPEVDYMQRHYPSCFSVKWGYVGPEYEPVTFAREVEFVYDYRMALKKANDAGEAIIKLALANLYGKFAQNTGNAFFQCRAWAGWITSLVRRLLLDAVRGIEDQIIGFAQDAVHFHGLNQLPASVTIGTGLGEWKQKHYDKACYLSPGIVEFYKTGESVKQRTRGSNLGIDFEQAARQLSDNQVASLSRSFFVGWLLSRQQGLKWGGSYLQEVEESLNLIPAQLRARNYTAQFDWLKEFRDSTINNGFAGVASARYIPNETSLSDSALRLKIKDRGRLWK